MTAIIDLWMGCGCLFLLVIVVLSLLLGISQGGNTRVIVDFGAGTGSIDA